MIKKLVILFKLGRKIAKSDILKITSKFHEPPILIKFLFKVLSLSFFSDKKIDNHSEEGERLSNSLQSMGTTFIKLGQFLATRPDIIGEELSKKLENLQDKLPPFSQNDAKKIIKDNLGEVTFNSIINLSEPVAAASIAQVHKAQINDNGTIKDVAIKILRPDIKKIFNEEIDAMMLFAFLIESFIKKTKRLKLVEVVFLLKEITNLEMDLRFEAAAANEYAENTKNDVGFNVPQIYWNFTSEQVMTLDWIEGVSIRETEELKKRNLNTEKIAEDIIQNFLRHAVRDGSYVRLRTLQIGYTLSDNLAAKIGAKSARVYYNGTNLLTLTDFRGLDPEVPRGGALDIGVYSSQYPTQSLSALGINIKF